MKAQVFLAELPQLTEVLAGALVKLVEEVVHELLALLPVLGEHAANLPYKELRVTLLLLTLAPTRCTLRPYVWREIWKRLLRQNANDAPLSKHCMMPLTRCFYAFASFSKSSMWRLKASIWLSLRMFCSFRSGCAIIGSLKWRLMNAISYAASASSSFSASRTSPDRLSTKNTSNAIST